MPTGTDRLGDPHKGRNPANHPLRSDSRSVGAQVVGGDRRRSRRWRSLRDRRTEVALVERALLHHWTLHATAAAGAARARSGAIGWSIAAATAGGGTAAARRRIATATAATMEQTAATTAGGHQKRESDGEEREAFHRDNPFRKGSEITAGENGRDCRSVDDSNEVSRLAAGRLCEKSEILTGFAQENRSTCRKAGER